MDRNKTRIFHGGLAQILAGEEDDWHTLREPHEPRAAIEVSLPHAGSPQASRDIASTAVPIASKATLVSSAAPPLAATHVLNEAEWQALCLSHRASPQPSHSAPVVAPKQTTPDESGRELRVLTAQLGLRSGRFKRLGLLAALVLLGAGGVCAQRASSVVSTASARPRPPAATRAQPVSSQHERAPDTAVPSSRERGPLARGLTRAAIDALAAGDDRAAAAVYRQLAEQAAQPAAFEAAAQILGEQTNHGDEGPK